MAAACNEVDSVLNVSLAIRTRQTVIVLGQSAFGLHQFILRFSDLLRILCMLRGPRLLQQQRPLLQPVPTHLLRPAVAQPGQP